MHSPVLYMGAEKNRLKTVSFPFAVLWCKIARKGECCFLLWYFDLLLKLIGATICVRFCLNHFCLEVNEGCLPNNKKDPYKIHIKPYTICS